MIISLTKSYIKEHKKAPSDLVEKLNSYSMFFTNDSQDPNSNDRVLSQSEKAYIVKVLKKASEVYSDEMYAILIILCYYLCLI